MNRIKFSIIIVSLNAGSDLNKTVYSVLAQNYSNYEIIIKDGLSTDQSIDNLPANNKINLYIEADNGIYHAMNQAIEYSTGDFILFLNSGDSLYTIDVLKKISEAIENSESSIFYGDNYTENRKTVLYAPKKFSDYTCFSTVLCHQSTVYKSEYIKNKKFDLEFCIAADVNFYVSSYKKEKIEPIYIPIIISSYKGGGFSETPSNKKKSLLEHKKILKENFDKNEYRKNNFKLLVRLIKLKQYLSTNSNFKIPYEKSAIFYYTLKNLNKKK